jgi:hypothetical protein
MARRPKRKRPHPLLADRTVEVVADYATTAFGEVAVTVTSPAGTDQGTAPTLLQAYDVAMTFVENHVDQLDANATTIHTWRGSATGFVGAWLAAGGTIPPPQRPGTFSATIETEHR